MINNHETSNRAKKNFQFFSDDDDDDDDDGCKNGHCGNGYGHGSGHGHSGGGGHGGHGGEGVYLKPLYVCCLFLKQLWMV